MSVQVSKAVGSGKTKIVVTLLAVLAIALLTALASCSTASLSNQSSVADASQAEEVSPIAEAGEDDVSDPCPQDTEQSEATAVGSDAESVHDFDQSTSVASGEVSNVNASHAEQDAQTPTSTPQPKQKTWVEDTERVWIIDKEAWTESVPVYGTVEVSICNICRTDITGNTSAHAKAHMKAGEGSGHHSETRQKITGYESVRHKEEGHWETRTIGGHWE